jgi:hypothetical protein
VALAVVTLAGCVSRGAGNSGSFNCDYTCAGCSHHDCGCGPAAPPSDLPKDPNPCLKYCRVWVEPVYRDVPRLTCDCGHACKNERIVEETCFETVCVPGKRYGCTTPERDCDVTAVQVCPGGYRWREAEDGCWRYCECQPTYKWCKKQIHEDGIAYCMDEPPEYKTVAVKTERRVCDVDYTPSGYKTTWCKELYKPGHWEWVLKDDCSPPPCGPCCCEPYSYCLDKTVTRTGGGCAPTAASRPCGCR